MKLSLEWLATFIDWKETDPRRIADRLTLSTAEVEEVEMQGELLEHCCVGKVIRIEKHPNADKLHLVDVETDKGMKRVVCGGTNLHEGMLVAFAHVGATVKWHGGECMTLEPVKIRGEKSEGMICAAEELGLEEMFPAQKEDGERPVVDLGRMAGYELRAASNNENLLEARSPKPKAGTPLRDFLGLNDAVLDINNTAITTRPDLFSHLGFARECVALGIATWKKQSIPARPKMTAGKAKATIRMKIDHPDLVPRYLAAGVEIDSLGETPEWMRRRLLAIGQRPVNLPVDITNYVASEIGVPLHSFDADDIRGDVHLRLSKKGETITTLDGVRRELPEGTLVLSDDEGVFDLLGIMGGLRSSTKASTKRIYLHAASLDASTIRHAIIATGHRTDASTVYEKGVPPIVAERGFYRALSLFLELVPGAKLSSPIEDKGTSGKPKAIALDPDSVRATLGADIGDKEMIDILKTLEFGVEKAAGHKSKKAARGSGAQSPSLRVTPPLHRLRDIGGPHDLVEEIGRIHGFNAIEPSMPSAPLRLPRRDSRLHAIRLALRGHGFFELVPLSLLSPSLLRRCAMDPAEAVAVRNPLGEDTSLLQPSTLPALLRHAEAHLSQAEGTLRTFQWGRVFQRNMPERSELSLLIAAKRDTTLEDDPFLQAKQAMCDACSRLGYEAVAERREDAEGYMHPGRSASVRVGNDMIGSVYEIHPSVRSAFDLPFRAAAATIDLNALLARAPVIGMMQPISPYPAVVYDETLTRTQDEPLGDMLDALRHGSPLLEDVSVKDIYTGKPLEGQAYNLTLRFIYRSRERTLTEEEARQAHAAVMEKMRIG